MGDLLGSLTKPHTVVARWLNGDNIGLKGTRGAQGRALDIVLRGSLQVVSEPVPSRKCASFGWWRKGLKEKRLFSIKIEVFS